MSRAQYVKKLERDFYASQQVINELTQEVHELKELLEAVQPHDERRIQASNDDTC